MNPIRLRLYLSIQLHYFHHWFDFGGIAVIRWLYTELSQQGRKQSIFPLPM